MELEGRGIFGQLINSPSSSSNNSNIMTGSHVGKSAAKKTDLSFGVGDVGLDAVLLFYPMS
jgi:hypothetical protein